MSSTVINNAWNTPEIVQYHVDRAKSVGAGVFTATKAKHPTHLVIMTPEQLTQFAQGCYESQSNLMAAE
jgi:hypothetical protein